MKIHATTAVVEEVAVETNLARVPAKAVPVLKSKLMMMTSLLYD